jgi:PRC-barrel domain
MQPGASSGSGMTGGTAGGSGMSGGAAGSTSGSTGMGSGSGGSTIGAGSGTAASGTAATAASGSTRPLAAPQPGQILGSDLRGTRVYAANNESIGDISDLLLDRQGRMVAAIVGVGGFLGIGQKDVAVPFEALEIVPQGASGGSGTGTGGSPATTGATGTAGSGTSGASGNSGTMNPDRIVLRSMTRADLESAPEFRASGGSGGSGSGTGSGASGAGGSGSAPRQ